MQLRVTHFFWKGPFPLAWLRSTFGVSLRSFVLQSEGLRIEVPSPRAFSQAFSFELLGSLHNMSVCLPPC